MQLRRLNTVVLLIGLGLAPLLGAVPSSLNLEDLRDHPERWPRTLPLPREAKTRHGAKIAQGTPMVFVELSGDRIRLEYGTEFSIVLPAAESDLVAEANQLWKALTPEQRALDYAALVADPSLWPDRVKIMEELSISNEWRQAKPGEECYLISCEADGVQLAFFDRGMQPIIVDARQTDVFERARARVLLPEAQRPSRLAEALQGHLVDAQGRKTSLANLAQAEWIAVYFGAGWCNPCRKFSPQLVQRLEPLLAQHPKLAIVFLSHDRSESAMQSYMQEVHMPWPGIGMQEWRNIGPLATLAKGMVPQLVVLNRQGQVLVDSFRGDKYVGPQPALQALLDHLEPGPAH